MAAIKPRFSLRFLLIVVTACAILLAILVPRIRHSREQAWLSSNGIFVGYSYQLDEEGTFLAHDGPPGPWLLRLIFGRDFFAEESFAVIDRPVDFEKLRTLAPNLKGIAVFYGEFNDDDLEQVAQFRSLRYLNASSAHEVTGEGVRHLVGHPNLRKFHLTNSRISDKDIPYLTSIPNLKQLSIGTFTFDGLKRLKEGLPNCKIFAVTSE